MYLRLTNVPGLSFIRKARVKRSKMENIYTQKVINANNVFTDSFLDVKMLYVYHFNLIPNMHFIGQIDGEKTFNIIKERLSGNIKDIHQTRFYNKKKKQFQFDIMVITMYRKCVVEIGTSYCEIFHDGQQEELIKIIADIAVQFKERERRQPLEINLVIQARNKLNLKAMEIKRMKLDLDLFYEDDFKQTDELIRKRLSQKNDKGIVLFHGLPGTGKTTYLRYLVGMIKKRVLFLSPSVAGNLMNPDFIELLIDNPNSVLIIEDAENIIMDRKYDSGSAVSNLLNISDGLLADFLNVQLICTFNSSVATIDSALMRKGRLIARYEFGKLKTEKAQVLSDHLGFNTVIKKPMTIAEIAHQHEKEYEDRKIEIVGFRRQETLLDQIN
jgi:hypothetical protein